MHAPSSSPRLLRRWLGSGLLAAVAVLGGCGEEVVHPLLLGEDDLAGTVPMDAALEGDLRRPRMDATAPPMPTDAHVDANLDAGPAADLTMLGNLDGGPRTDGPPPPPPDMRCVDTCQVGGATQCGAGQLKTCARGASGCLEWSASVPCADKFCKDNSSCGLCNNGCPLKDATRCMNNAFSVCVADGNGCLSWGPATPCPSGFCQDALVCGACNNKCPKGGDTRCDVGKLSTCAADMRGCLDWSAPVPCADGFCKDALACGMCNHACAMLRDLQCAAGALSTCVADANGCRAWGPASPCADGFCQDKVSCGKCNNTCNKAGVTRCMNGTQETCTADANKCLAWAQAIACGPRGCLDALVCDPDECGAWGASCNGGTLETCVLDNNKHYKLITEKCALGCSAGACNGCGGYTSPRLSAVKDDKSGWYQELQNSGSTVIAAYNRRSGNFSTNDYGITTVDATNPSAMALGNVSLNVGDYVSNIQLVGKTLYHLNSGGVQILDATEPLSPKPLGSYAYKNTPVIKRWLSVNGTLACLATDDGLHLLDVTQPNAVKEIGLYISIFQTPQMVRCVGKYAAIAGQQGVEIVDLSDPRKPKFAAKMAISLIRVDLIFDGTFVYTRSYDDYGQQVWSTLEILRFTPPGTLTREGTVRYIDGLQSIHVAGKSVYLGMAESFGEVDISVPASPVWKKRITLNDSIQGLLYAGGTVYAAGNGVAAFDLSRAGDLTITSRSTTDPIGRAVSVGSLAYVARGSGLVIQDMRDPRKPVQLSKTALFGTDIVLDGSTAYVTTTTGGNTIGLSIFDVRNPYTPVLLGSVSNNLGNFGVASIRGLTLNKGRAYAPCSVGALCVFDVSNPLKPTMSQSGVINDVIGHSTSLVRQRGDTLFVGTDQSITTIDISNLAAPVKISTLKLAGSTGPYGLLLKGNYGLVMMPCNGQYGSCAYSLDLANPAAMAVLGNVAMEPTYMPNLYALVSSSVIGWMEWHGDRVFINSMWGGMLMLDMSVPAAPKRVTEYWTTLPARGNFLHERYLTVFGAAEDKYPMPAAAADNVFSLCP